MPLEISSSYWVSSFLVALIKSQPLANRPLNFPEAQPEVLSISRASAVRPNASCRVSAPARHQQYMPLQTIGKHSKPSTVHISNKLK